MSSNLVAIAYPDQQQATNVMNTLRRLESEQLLDLGHAVFMAKDFGGKVHLRQPAGSTGRRAVTGGLWGLLIGTFLLAPAAGAALGAAGGALSSRFVDLGIDRDFARAVGDQLQPGGLALVVQVQSANADRVIADVGRHGGSVLLTTLTPETEARLSEELQAEDPDPESGPISLDAEVQCADGPGGRTTRLVVDPASRRVTHLVVRESGWRGIERIVPIQMVEESAPGAVRLRITRTELADMPSFAVDESIVPGDIAGDDTSYIVAGYRTGPTARSYTVTGDAVPDSMLVVRQGDRVEASDGRIGTVDDILADASGAISGFVMRKGHLWGARNVVVPLEAVDYADDGVVYLKLSKAAIEAFDHSGIAAGGAGTVTLYDEARGVRLGSVTGEQFRAMVSQLEEESTTDRNYYVNQATIELLEQGGADPALLDLLRAAIADQGEAEIRWERG